MRYDMTVHIDPPMHHIYVKGVVRGIECSETPRFYINENFNIISLKSGLSDIKYFFDKNGSHPPFDTVSRPVILNTDAQGPAPELSFEYEGCIPSLISGINQIGTDIIELAGYSGWYPKDIGNFGNSFDFTVDVKLPAGYVLASNGEISQSQAGGACLYSIASYKPAKDIAIFASNLVTHMEKTVDGLSIHAYYSDKMKDIIEKKLDYIVTGYNRLNELFGEIQVSNVLRFAYRPAGGWGYLRTPLSVVSEEFIIKNASEKFGFERSSHGDFHELAHSWWSIAPANSFEDWINEGGAEFSAFTLSRELFGEQFEAKLIDEYKEHIDMYECGNSILETTYTSRDRYVNQYEKTTLMYIGAEKRFGRKALSDFLKSFYRRYSGTLEATTASFLEMCEEALGSGAKDYFRHLLTLKSWKGLLI